MYTIVLCTHHTLPEGLEAGSALRLAALADAQTAKYAASTPSTTVRVLVIAN